jgi:Flp pilus assembly protein TadB
MILWGLFTGIGCVLIRKSLRRPVLATVLPKYGYGTTATNSKFENFRHTIEQRFAVSSTDLAVCRSSAAKITTERLICAAISAAIPLLMIVVTTTAGTPLPLPLLLITSLALSVVGFMLPALQLRTRAKAKRREFRTSLSAYLDLVSIMLAGGAGIESALVAASQVGDGPTFHLIADSLDVARASRRSPWEILAIEGERIGIDELPELAATIKLGGEQGARMTASLVAKASSMRAKQLAEIEADANAATERMGLPMVLLFMGFLILLGYPAMQMISAGFGS